jgi:hypothetical protein
MKKWTRNGYEDLTEEEVAQRLIDEAASTADRNANLYKQLRQAEYPPITDYIDGIVKGDTVQVQAYIDACLAVKLKYPKPV